MNRRALLAAGPAALVAAPASALCIIDPAETPVMRLFREWEAHTRIVISACDDHDMPEDEFEELSQRQTDIEDEIARIPPQNLRDFAAKMFARSTGGKMDLPREEDCPGLWAGVRDLIG
ncbi:hypothetical protein [Paracoccus sp. pheM1]|uniref:hypothetical protein n=1 Tax=Paracoccus sp. pheM1 TaxID=2831675 RepID=UPI001BDB7E1C|nr:hypothetical protein [Paracoccus sp. pheM1]MBT0780586.1 hypothetical protein [Paracoccus sp. pheM1]